MKALLLLLVACRSASSSYYTLVSAPTEPAAASNALQVDILPVDVPADVDRAEIVVRTSAGEVTPVHTRAWIAPLSLELRRAFSDDLTRELGARDIEGITPAAGIPTFRVKLSVRRFESLLDKQAVIEAVSTVHDLSTTTAPLVCSHRASVPAGAGYAKLAEAHQQALATIAKQVAASIHTGTCGHE